MKTSDINAFKGKAKDAILAWAGEQIDQLLPNKVAARAMLKNAAANIVERFDHKINQGIDAAFLMLGDTQGNIDSDSLVDLVCDMLKEMPRRPGMRHAEGDASDRLRPRPNRRDHRQRGNLPAIPGRTNQRPHHRRSGWG